MTAYHVISGNLSNTKKVMLGFKPSDELSVKVYVDGCRAKVLRVDKEADLALLEMCATNPARIFSLADRGTLKDNAYADVTILDPQLEWVFDVNRSRSKSRNTPFHGRSMHGAAVATIVGGRLVYLHPDYSRINELKQRGASV